MSTQIQAFIDSYRAETTQENNKKAIKTLFPKNNAQILNHKNVKKSTQSFIQIFFEIITVIYMLNIFKF